MWFQSVTGHCLLNPAVSAISVGTAIAGLWTASAHAVRREGGGAVGAARHAVAGDGPFALLIGAVAAA
eukprot:4536875-Alexandrium_andersonii.AAC.1